MRSELDMMAAPEQAATGGRRILIVTSLYSVASIFMLGLCVRLSSFESSLRALVAGLMSRIPGVEIVLKSHPVYDHYDLYESVLRASPASVKAHQRARMEVDDTLEADLVVLYNCVSTVFLSLAAHGLPVVSHCGALTALSRRIMATSALAGSDDSAELADLIAGILASPNGDAAQDARRRAQEVYRSVVHPSSGGLDEAVAFALERAGEQIGGSRAPWC